MSPKITGFLSRSELKMRLPRSVSYNINPERGGSTKHYGGSGSAPIKHEDCLKRWLSWQNYHMDGHGWVDIAYTAGYCNHGYVFAGRGYGVRTAAQGTDIGNQTAYAFVWIGGDVDNPTRAALDALDWLIVDARAHGKAGKLFNNHRDWHSTGCPGDYLAKYAGDFLLPNKADLPSPTSAKRAWPLPRDEYYGPNFSEAKNHSGYFDRDKPAIVAIQRRLGITQDGNFGPMTAQAVASWQRKQGIKAAVYGRVDSTTWGYLFNG